MLKISGNLRIWKKKCTHFQFWVNNQVSHQSELDISSWSPNSKRSQIGHSSQLYVSVNMSSRSKNIIYRDLHIILEC